MSDTFGTGSGTPDNVPAPAFEPSAAVEPPTPFPTPAFEPPPAMLGAEPLAAPTEPLPAVVPPPMMSEAPAAVASAGRSGSKLPWIVAAVLGVTAIVFAVLWVGKSGEADDLGKERDSLTAELDTTRNDLASANSELDTTNETLSSTEADLGEANNTITSLNDDVAELEGTVAELEADLELATQPPAVSDELALVMGRAFGQGAEPAFTDEESLCFGREALKVVSFEALLIFGYSADPPAQNRREVFRALDAAVEACNIDLSRIGG